jgi:3-hydroxybutyryl-CoA dehydrogenase
MWFKVKAVTEVLIPSVEHSRVPYYTVLTEDEFGYRHLTKTYKRYVVGDVIETGPKEEVSKTKLVGVVGAGALGKDIVKVLLASGYHVVLRGKTEEQISKAAAEIKKYLVKTLGDEGADQMKNLRATVDLSEFKDAEYVIECVTENLQKKHEVYRDLEKVCSSKAVFASNTSSLSVDELSTVLADPARLVGMHFFNPATKMQLVEVVRGQKTSDAAVTAVVCLSKGINKIPVVVKDSPGFVVNRVLMPFLNEAVYVLMEQVASKEDIDMSAKLALNHPMGPLQLLDLIGLDVFIEIMNNLYRYTGNPKYKPCPLAEEMVREGKLGKKIGEGFYKY